MQQNLPVKKHRLIALWDVCALGAREEHNEKQRWG